MAARVRQQPRQLVPVAALARLAGRRPGGGAASRHRSREACRRAAHVVTALDPRPFVAPTAVFGAGRLARARETTRPRGRVRNERRAGTNSPASTRSPEKHGTPQNASASATPSGELETGPPVATTR